MGSRYINNLVLNTEPAEVENAIQVYLRGNDFKLVTEKGEQYYKTGGVMLPLRGFKYRYEDGILHLEAWVGKIGKEMNIGDGKLLGAAAKVPYYNSILSLLDILAKTKPVNYQPNVYEQSGMQMDESLSSHQQFAASTQTVSSVTDEVNNANERNAKIALLLSIISLILVFGSKFSLLLTLGSYTLAIKYGLKSHKSGLAVTAIAISTITVILTVLLLLLSFSSAY